MAVTEEPGVVEYAGKGHPLAEWLDDHGWTVERLRRALEDQGTTVDVRTIDAWLAGSTPTLPNAVSVERVTAGAVTCCDMLPDSPEA